MPARPDPRRPRALNLPLSSGGFEPDVVADPSASVEAPGIEFIRTGDRVPDFCTPIVDPGWVSADDADHMREDDPVVGYLTSGMAWALPWWVMKNHHVANLELEGETTLVSFCENCAGAAAWNPIVDGKRLGFRVEAVYNGAIVLIDYESGSLWAALTGHAITGAYIGTRLERRPVVQCRWDEWKAMHPKTLVLDGIGEKRTGHGSLFRTPDEQRKNPFVARVRNLDDRMPEQELVLGVVVGEDTRAYPLHALQDAGGVANDVLGGVPVLAAARPGTWLSAAFRREVRGSQPDFELDGERLVDTATHSRWDFFGRCESGPCEGERLVFVPSGVEKWFAWAASHPGTDIWAP
jgi:hypothetical protein